MGYAFFEDCLPGEPHALNCGMGYGAHALAYLVYLRSVCNHQIKHLEPPIELLRHLVKQASTDLERRCQDR